jgi:hypothetical protein
MTIINTMNNEINADSLSISSQVPPVAIATGLSSDIKDSASRGELVPQMVSRKSGDEVNRFLLCSLVSKSAKRIKARIERQGERLPMSAIMKGVMRSYQLAAAEQPDLFAGPTINRASLANLVEKIFKDEIKRHSQDIVRTNQARLVQANRIGDEERIKAETEALERALKSRNQIARELK